MICFSVGVYIRSLLTEFGSKSQMNESTPTVLSPLTSLLKMPQSRQRSSITHSLLFYISNSCCTFSPKDVTPKGSQNNKILRHHESTMGDLPFLASWDMFSFGMLALEICTLKDPSQILKIQNSRKTPHDYLQAWICIEFLLYPLV